MKSIPMICGLPLVLITFATLIPAALSVVCYSPDGTSSSAGDSEFGHCPYLNDGASMCCSLNRDNPSGGNFSAGNTADKCLQNGLCINIGTNDTGSKITTYYRDLCSKTDWNKGCLNICTDDEKNGSSTGTSQMTPCDGTKDSKYWCCGESDSCCGTSEQVNINSTFTPSKTTTHTTHHTATSTTTSTKAATSSPSPSPESYDLSKGTKIGIAVGIGLGSTAIIVGIIRLCMKRGGHHGGHHELVPESDGVPLVSTSMKQHMSAQSGNQGYSAPVLYDNGFNGESTAYSGAGVNHGPYEPVRESQFL